MSSEREAVKAFRALGDRTRYQIVRRLLERGEVACSDIVKMFPLSAPALFHQLVPRFVPAGRRARR